jgi:hypothetical protein
MVLSLGLYRASRKRFQDRRALDRTSKAHASRPVSRREILFHRLSQFRRGEATSVPGEVLRLESTENREAAVRETLSRITAELRQALDDLPSDLQAQVAIWSAIAFVNLVLDHHLAAGCRAAATLGPIRIVPPPQKS